MCSRWRWRLKTVLWASFCASALTHQSFSQSSSECPQAGPYPLFDKLAKGAGYSYQDNVQYSTGSESVSTSVTVNVTPATGSCHDYYTALKTCPTPFGYMEGPVRIELKEPVQETKFACHCDNKFYDDILSCQKECHVTLGCFVGICSPAEPRVCRTAVAYCNEIEVNAINVVLWEPTDPADQKPQCLAMAAAVDQAILAHEAAHVSSLATHALSLPPREMRATSCGENLAEVDKENGEKLQSEVHICFATFGGGYNTDPNNPDISLSNPFRHGADDFMKCDNECP
jgi:hypothetical protein